MEGGLDMVRRLISVIKNEVEAHNVVGRFSEWKRRVQKAMDELDSANMGDLSLLSIDIGDPAQRKSVNRYYPSTDDKAKLDGLIRLQLEHQDRTSTAVRRANVDVAETLSEIRAWVEGLVWWNHMVLASSGMYIYGCRPPTCTERTVVPFSSTRTRSLSSPCPLPSVCHSSPYGSP